MRSRESLEPVYLRVLKELEESGDFSKLDYDGRGFFCKDDYGSYSHIDFVLKPGYKELKSFPRKIDGIKIFVHHSSKG